MRYLKYTFIQASENKMLINSCPYSSTVRVGSQTCSRCEFHCGTIKRKQFVLCNMDESLFTKNSKTNFKFIITEKIYRR